MSDDTTARDAGEALVERVGDEIWVDLRPHLVESDPLHSAIEDTARHVIRIVREHDAAPPAEALVERVALAIGRRDECEFDDDGNPTNCPSDESLIFEWSDHARDAIAAVRAHDAAPPAPEGTIHIGSAEIRPFNDPIRAHDVAPPAEDAVVERIAEAIDVAAHDLLHLSIRDKELDALARAALAAMPAEDAVERVAKAIYDESPLLWLRDKDGDKLPWSVARRDRRPDYPDGRGDAVYRLARAAIAAMPAPGDTLEGLLGDEWEIAQARRDDSGRWIVAVWRLPYSPRQLIRDGAYGTGPTIRDAARAAIAAAKG